MLRRRRPLLRAAAVGGGAYVAGKRAARRSAERQQQADEQDGRISNLEQQNAPAQPQPAAAPTSSMLDQLNQLSDLHDKGALTDPEFTAAKATLLAT
jgi:Short C-terminal domain